MKQKQKNPRDCDNMSLFELFLSLYGRKLDEKQLEKKVALAKVFQECSMREDDFRGIIFVMWIELLSLH